jgi:hypothetical protein
LVLSIAAVGCGDDDSDDTTASGGTGGAKTGGTGGKGGSGGSAGKGGAGGTAGSSADPGKCVTDTTALMKDAKDALSSACITCICNQKPAAIQACNTAPNGACWNLLSCGAANGCGVGDSNAQTNCVTTHCVAEIGASGAITPAQGASPVITMGECMSKCATDTADAGTHDAGF